jgi:hypothetical protein
MESKKVNFMGVERNYISLSFKASFYITVQKLGLIMNCVP